MKFKLLGYELRLEVVIVCVLLGMYIQGNTFCNCLTQEGMSSAGALIDDVMGKGLKKMEKVIHPRNNPNETYERPTVPMREGELFFYSNNDFKPECCKTSTVSSASGCACETPEQLEFIRRRGGNDDGSGI